MAGDIKLSSAIRSNLLALQKTATKVATTQGRLSTGLKVSSAVDDAVSFFQAKSLSDRASDLSGRKDDIDQGISSLTTALQAVESVEELFTQMKGLLLSAKASTDTERATLASQFNELSYQINNLVNDASYQGLNLVNSTTASLKVTFSEKTSSFLQVSGTSNQVSLFSGLSNSAASLIATNTTGLSTGWAVGTGVSAFDVVIANIDTAVTTPSLERKDARLQRIVVEDAARLHLDLCEYVDAGVGQTDAGRSQRRRR